MNDSAMKEILGKDIYKDVNGNFYNVFINYINYWIKYDSSKEEIDQFWFKQIDSSFAAADTMFSLFIPLKNVVRLSTERTITKNKLKKEFAKANNKEEYLRSILPQNDELVKSLQKFAILCSQKQNVIGVPNIKVEDLSINQYRGCCYFDQMQVMLYCIIKGKLTEKENRFSKYFKDKDEVVLWLKENHLDRLLDVNINDNFKLDDLKNYEDEYYRIKKIGLSITKKDYLFDNINDKNRLKKVLDEFVKILEETI